MKKKIFSILLFLICFFIIPESSYDIEIQNLNKEFDEWRRCFEYTTIGAIAQNNNFVIIKNWGFREYIFKLDLDQIPLDKDGYKKFTIMGQDYLALFGDNFFFIFDYDDSSRFVMFKSEESSSKPLAFMRVVTLGGNSSFQQYKEILAYKEDLQGLPYDIEKEIKFSIKKIESSSYFTENLKSGDYVEYKADFLNLILLLQDFWSDWLAKSPWVPGKEKNEAGIGESLTIEFSEPKNNVVILNGYVDFFKRYLYKANNRVKTAIIKSLDADKPFEIEYTFEDFVHFAQIELPFKVNKIQFIIKDVYKGERWNDTCVSAVITRYNRRDRHDW